MAASFRVAATFWLGVVGAGALRLNENVINNEIPSKSRVIILGNVDTGKSSLCQWLLARTDRCTVFKGTANDGSKNTQELELATGGYWFGDPNLGELEVLDTPGFTLNPNDADDASNWVNFTDYVKNNFAKIDAVIYATNTGGETGALKQGVVNKLRQSFGSDIWDNLIKFTPIREGWTRSDFGEFGYDGCGWPGTAACGGDDPTEWELHQTYWRETYEKAEFDESTTDWTKPEHAASKLVLEDEIARSPMYGCQFTVEPGYYPMVSVASTDFLAAYNIFEPKFRPDFSQLEVDTELGVSNITGLLDMRREILAKRALREPVGQWDVTHLRPRFGPSEVDENQVFTCTWPHECRLEVTGALLSDNDQLQVFPKDHVCGTEFAGYDDEVVKPVSHPRERPQFVEPEVKTSKTFVLGDTTKLSGFGAAEYKLCYCEYGNCKAPERFFHEVGILTIVNTKCNLPCDSADHNAVLTTGTCGPDVFLLAGESVDYACVLGHEFAGGQAEPRLCDQQGVLKSMQTCTRVKCSSQPEVPANSKRLTADSGVFKFQDPLLFECDDGYTKDGNPEASKRVDIQCDATGQWQLQNHVLGENWAQFLANGGCRRWTTAEWGTCSSTCGKGKRTRLAACEPVAAKCNMAFLPEVETECIGSGACPNCGAVPDLSEVHAKLAYNKDHALPTPEPNGAPVFYDCDHHNGYTLDGGDSRSHDVTSFQVSCKLDVMSVPLSPKFEWKKFTADGVFTEDDLVKGCRRWETSEWGDCSVTCGSGYQFRTIRCSTGDDADCLAKAKPVATVLSKTCNEDACEVPKEEEKTAPNRVGKTSTGVALLFIAGSIVAGLHN